ncbi:MAG: hypothetical protein SPL37_06405 [Prevotella sp.]|jgi:hypothetical protein|nr:hypothetical protein [Prevotella sp.]
MGNVIFWGTLITMLLILTVIPVSYWLAIGINQRWTEVGNAYAAQQSSIYSYKVATNQK